ncbi:MAG TPA: polysaccharide biosynthesis/export family protein, partial [Bacteroidia bacterium]|nr:polysaccharide biosynthesis/export family protein [Bacteroidia bacterium]HQW22374.1 polysaccharide biosynthesis/export family protein [Bacteroidia bacterium]
MQNKRQLFLLLSIIFFFGCTSQKNTIYFQGVTPKLQQDASSKLRIYPNDILGINIFTINAEAYPYLSTGIDKAVSDNRSAYEKGFVVNENGELKLPLIGTVNLTGLTIAEAVTLLETKFKEFIDEPIVTIKKLNFKVTILGEVNKPGTYPISNEKATILEVLGLGGDLSTYGDRKNVHIIRTENNQTKDLYIDLTNSETLTPEAYFLHPDDVIYVSPVKRRSFANISPTVLVFTSIVTTGIVVMTFIIQTNK